MAELPSEKRLSDSEESSSNISEAETAARREVSTPENASSGPEHTRLPNEQELKEIAKELESSQDQDPLIGKVLADRYRIEGVLGMGGMGRVYLAEHIHMRKKVALKTLLPELSQLPEVVKRFEREAVAAGNITHPNIASATDFGKLDNGTFYLALEYVEGRSLREELKQGALPSVRAVEIARQIASALAAAHKANIIHRDLKPGNVMLQQGTDGETVKVLDFGVAKLPPTATGEDKPLTRLGAIVGTPAYMAPEQGAGDKVDSRSDLYALGVILYEMLKGERPFTGPNPAVILSKHIKEPPPELPAAIDRRLRELVKKLLAKKPEERPQSAKAVVAELSALQRASQRSVAQGSMTVPQDVGANLHVASRAARAMFQSILHASKPVLKSGWQLATTRFPKLKTLQTPVRIHTLSLPLGALIGLVLTGAVVVLAVGLSLSGEEQPPPKAKPQPEKKKHLNRRELKAAAEVPTVQISEEFVQKILDKPVYKRPVEDWLTLGHAYAQRGKWKKSASAYRNAMQLRSKLKNDKNIQLQLRRAAEDPKAYQYAINVLVNMLDATGLDIVYQVWLDTKDKPTLKHIAEWAHRKLEILRLQTASKALRVRLELEFTNREDCEHLASVVELAVVHADQRSLPLLEKLQSRKGCGKSKRRDCYPCLRGNDNLKQALLRARNTPPPELP